MSLRAPSPPLKPHTVSCELSQSGNRFSSRQLRGCPKNHVLECTVKEWGWVQKVALFLGKTKFHFVGKKNRAAPGMGLRTVQAFLKHFEHLLITIRKVAPHNRKAIFPDGSRRSFQITALLARKQNTRIIFDTPHLPRVSG